MNGRQFFFILLRLQSLRFINRLLALRSYSVSAMIVGAVIVLFALLGLHLVMESSLHRLLDTDGLRSALQRMIGTSQDPLRFTRYEDVADQGARLMLVFLNSLLLSALLLKWGRWQSLQRDAEWEWFAERPWPAWPLFVQRCLIESLWPQAYSLFILPFFVLLGIRRGMHPLAALGLSLMLTLILQTMLAIPRLSLDLFLRLRWPAARVRTFRGISGIVGAGLLVLGMQSLSIDSAWTVSAVMNYGSFWDHTPAARALSALILRDHAAGLRHGLGLLLWVIGIHSVCLIWAAKVLRRPVSKPELWSGQAAWRVERWPGLWILIWSRLHPLIRRDLLLLQRDRHFMLQILLAPLVFAIVPQGLPRQDGPWLLLMSFAAGLLFLWTAVFHILPMEGRGVWMLFTWPQSLAHFLRRRLTVLLVLAGFYVSLLLGLGLWRSGVKAHFEIWQLLYISWGLLAFGVVLTALMIFVFQPEADSREQRPALLLNYGILILGGLYAWFLFRSDVVESLIMMILLALLAVYLWWRMVQLLPALLERHTSGKKMLARRSFTLYFFRSILR